MAEQIINIGTLANDGTGDTLREASRKSRDNDTELYSIKEDVINKKTDVETNKTSDSFYPSIKSIVDWIVARFSPITPWSAGAYLLNDQVNHLGQDWYANAATLSTDIPGTSSKWVERLSGYLLRDKVIEKPAFNLFDESKAVISLSEYKLSGYVEVTPSKAMCLSTEGIHHDYFTDIKFFNSSFVQITSPTITTLNYTVRSGKIFTTPSDCMYMSFTWRFKFSGGDLAKNIMLHEGTLTLYYAAFDLQHYFNSSPYVKKSEIDFIGYVSLLGLDTNDGKTFATAFKTFQKAIDTGVKVIYAERGVYLRQVINASGLNKLHILPYDNSEVYSHTNPKRKLIEIKNSYLLETLVNNAGILSQAFAGSVFFNEIFVTKTLSLYNGTSPRAVTWQLHADSSLDIRLVPKATIAEVNSTVGTFTWDGTNIYINPFATAYTSFEVCASADENIIKINNCKDIKLQDVSAKNGMYNNISVINSINCELINCRSFYTNYYMGYLLDNSNVNLYKCKATKSQYDGFNMHHYGDTNFFDCESVYNYDDGMSHHDGCTGSVIGGVYSFNGKAGIAPAYGAIDINISNAVFEGNAIGVGYLTTPNGHALMRGVVNSCLFLNNTNGLKVDALATVKAINCKYLGNTVDKVVTGILTEY